MSGNVEAAGASPGLVSPDADRGFLVNMNGLVQRCRESAKTGLQQWLSPDHGSSG
jgi:hypothetical protein